MKEIQLTQGKVALVDDADFETLNQHKWHAAQRADGSYCVTRSSARVQGKQRTIYMHCEITGEKGIDHRDGNGLNNQRYNLRPASKLQNRMNVGKHPTGSTSKYKGVSLATAQRSKPWFAQLKVSGKSLNLGYHATEIDAAKAYDAAALEHYGEFAWLNFPLDNRPQALKH